MKSIVINTYSQKLYKKLEADLECIRVANEDIISVANKSINLVRQSIDQLKAFVHQHQFCNNTEEISFFKEVKPRFMCRYYYYESLYNIRVGEPIGAIGDIKVYYADHLARLQTFITDHRAFYDYYFSDSTHWDDKYFIRGKQILNPELDTKFTTGFDLTLAKFLANQRIKEHLEKLLRELDSSQQVNGVGFLCWTGTKTSLIELIYGLQSAAVINNGNADIKQIATSFESIFGMSLGNYYRVFQDIRLRKNGQANFLDQLREKFVERVNEFD